VKAKICLVRTSKSACTLLYVKARAHTFISDYATNELLDQYSDADLDDETQFDAMDPRSRRAAELALAQRDRQERGGRRGARAARRSRAAFLDDDDDMQDEDATAGGLLSGLKPRTRRQYDERRDIDDMEGVEDVSASTFCVLHC
jgi:DNA replication licensing factor MCM2